MLILLFKDIAPKYVERPGGYTRVVKLGYRNNDRAPVSLIEFVDMVEISSSEEKKTDASQKINFKSSVIFSIMVILRFLSKLFYLASFFISSEGLKSYLDR